MRVPFRDNIQSFGSRLAPIEWPRVIEKLLLGVLALQCARLVWAVLTPVGSFGPWEGRQAQFPSVAARQALFSSFDPFYRAGPQQAAGGGVVTSLALTVYGIRLNEGSGLGSAIVAGPDGVQNSFAVGEEILPGVVLKAVAFDHITIDRGGAEEQVFLDQSQPASDAPAPGEGAPPVPVTGIDNPTADGLKRDIGFAPRMQNGRITGLILTGRGPTFQNAGFQPGDIVTQVDGQPVGSPSDLQALQGKIVPGARISLTVERGASLSTINLTLQGQ
ncbi:Secretion system protein C precursor [Sphingobium herbicidovorans NBRC 16415]|uniref:Secretion system protein C n=1 Tax=Sphingobium herbicidovorans (strain ATCC 700291 / DSM 11019 / CCUG 56400 / KCTC 2939 / LMG 18315 / NBRC 16415 / MH) TaxID=1219045 RepID=A0A086P887_SPHHM|nr:type II secretion system protein N [Sphingobium herbicidovorans]KFG89605.1 Secretion system protein C precursor [Sphingobium herbicidovorans NBRC 16415]